VYVKVIWLRWAENPILNFPIKKRIKTELFIDGKQELYMHKGRIKTSGREVTEIGSDAKIGGDENQ